MNLFFGIYIFINVVIGLLVLITCTIFLLMEKDFGQGFNWKLFAMVPTAIWVGLNNINRVGKTILIILWTTLFSAAQILNIVIYIIYLLGRSVCLAYKEMFKKK